ncbi:MAG: rhodanese-like domain-containing protein [Bacillota bacterium]|nr:rhodanese-like domain-containing protein [Bacillota bacterium]
MFNRSSGRCQTLSMREAKQELEKTQDIKVIDVRTREEYREGHITGSLHIPLSNLPWSLDQLAPQRDARIFVYCLSGSRSSQACSYMMRQGYSNVTNIGGIMNWPGPVSVGDQ